ncbi:MAG TPA: hypothetical protein ENK08_02370 [Chloroflexi bacterium]|nr:hypothetical protein [Chloroflexota bacterium]
MSGSRRLSTALLLIGVLLIGAAFRFFGLGWGEGQPIHPDEEFLRQVTMAVRFPDRLSLYLDTSNSPLNLYNRGYGFFVYGTFPLFLTRGALDGLEKASEAGSLLVWKGPLDARAVGRALAALFDVGSVLFVFLAGRRLGSRWIGLLGALFYALSVLPIQQAHFYTVDAFANFFVAVTLYLAVRAAQTGGWASFLLAGITTGLGVACKISVWPLGLLLGVAGLVWGGWYAPRTSAGSAPWESVTARVFAAGVLSLVTFRLAQPYAFAGPGFFGLALNKQWVQNMAEIRSLMSGAVDTYPGHQWTNRTPLVFPWVNMVFWGLGLPLGLTAWAAWGSVGVKGFRWWVAARRKQDSAAQAEESKGEEKAPVSSEPLRRSLEPPGREAAAVGLVWVWATGYFLYQGTQWVKSMRYLLPVYPAFALLAAWWVAHLWGGGRTKRRWGMAVGTVALVGAFLWSLAFSSVYARPHTRIVASRWIFENVPTAATVHLEAAESEAHVQVVIPPGTFCDEEIPLVVPFQVEEGGEGPFAAVAVSLNYVADPQADLEPETVRVAIATDPAGQDRLAEAAQQIDPPGGRGGKRYTFSLPPTPLQEGATYYLVVEVTEGGPIQLFTSVLATEHWDWPPPLRVDGKDPFGGMYQGLSTSSDGTLQLYYDDTPEKRENLLNWLNEADYIIIGSNRLYASIPRLPTRYPLTIAYYQALFSGELGFELVADFTSYPALGPFQFPDTEEPFPVPEAPYQYRAAPISVPMPPAEEAFSVYDHPRVLVFRKTAAYSRERAEALLPPSLLNHVIWVTPRQATRGVREPVFDPQTWKEQQAGGTWSEMFNRDSPLNRSWLLAALAWYGMAAVLGWLAFPLVFLLFPKFVDRGYGFGRVLGLLFVSYLTWLVASLRILPNTRMTVVVSVGVLALAGGFVAWRQRESLARFLRLRWRTVAVYEALFLILFGFWTWVRLLNPDLWHPVVGGEKPMDFAYLNAVIKSTWFPPYDPWFAGGYINYYYFGFVLVGTLSKLLGVMPSIAYNLALSLFYALTGGAAFCVAFNLVGRGKASDRAYVAGLLAVLLLLVLGNLGEVRLLVNGFRLVAGEPPFESTIPGFAELVQTLRGFWLVAKGAPLPFRPETPYWDPTRMYPADPLGVGPITEFPSFTFLYGDLHAHMLALPYTLVMLGLALQWALIRRPSMGSLVLGGLVVGCLRAGNTWDYPTYLLVAWIGLALGTLGKGRSSWRDGWAFLWRAAVLLLTSLLLFQPYIRHYVIAYTHFHLWDGLRTPLHLYLLHLGHFLFFLLTLMLPEAWAVARSALEIRERGKRTAVAVLLGGVLSLAAALFLGSGVPVALVTVPVGALAAVLALRRERPVERRLIWSWLALAMGLTLGVELVVLEGDIGRMNTVFKFYYQVWTMLAVGAAAAAVWAVERVAAWRVEWQQVWSAVAAVLLFSALLFPLMSIPARVKDRITKATGPTLDGMAYMEYGRVWDVLGEVDLRPDYEAIVWLLDNVEGSPVVLEGLGAREYLWGNRVSVYTGLPSVVGWRWHQVQQRMAAGAADVEQRQMDVNECYETLDVGLAETILRRYDVRYVYVGPYERLYYSPDGLAKFDEMADLGMLRVVYDREGVRIYEVTW